MTVQWESADWSRLEATHKQGFVEADIDFFVEETFATYERLGFSLEEMYDINMPFFEAKEDVFASAYNLELGSQQLQSLQQLFRVPKKCEDEFDNVYPRTKLFEFI